MINPYAAQTISTASGTWPPAVADRQPEMGDAGFEVVQKAGDRVRQLGLVVGDDAVGKFPGNLA